MEEIYTLTGNPEDLALLERFEQAIERGIQKAKDRKQ